MISFYDVGYDESRIEKIVIYIGAYIQALIVFTIS